MSDTARRAGQSKDRPLHRLRPDAEIKNPRAGETGAGEQSENEEMLPGSESSSGQNSEAPTLEGDAEIWPDEGRQSRRNYRGSDRKAEPQPRETRVRFKFARRAHQRKFTPKLGINLAVSSCQEERGKDGEKVAKGGKSGVRGGDSIEWSWAELPGSAA